MRVYGLSLILASAGLLLCTGGVRAQQYNILDLGGLGSNSATGQGLNNGRL